MSECSCHVAPPCGYCLSLCPRCLKSPADASTEHWAEPACEGCKADVLKEIPDGHYCYTYLGMDEEKGIMKIKACPFWSKHADKPEQENGHCALLGKGDWEFEGIGILWDQVKECNEKIGDLQDP